MYEILIFHGAGLIKSRNERKEGKKVKWIIGIKGMGIKKKKDRSKRERRSGIGTGRGSRRSR